MRIKFTVIFLATVAIFTSVENGLGQTNSFEYARPLPSFKIAETVLETSSRVQHAPTSRRRPPIFTGQTNSVETISVKAAAVTRDTQRIPNRDLSTSPHRAVPKVDKAAFQTGINFTTSPTVSSARGYARDNAVEPSTYNAPKPKDQSVEPPVEGNVLVEVVPSPRSMISQPNIVANPDWSNQSEWVAGDFERFKISHGQPRSNFFGVSEADCGDEWDGFAPCKQVNEHYYCGGYCCGDWHAKPGHLGRRAMKDQDPCESARRGHCKRGHRKH